MGDAGPLLHLYWVGASSWALPPAPIDVVDVVWNEVVAYAPEALAGALIRRVEAPVDRSPEVLSLTLDDGDSAAISYAMDPVRRSEALVLCDELRGRRACRRFGLSVVGSIGLIVEAYRAGRVLRGVAVTSLLDLPVRGRLHVTTLLVQAAVDALGSKS